MDSNLTTPSIVANSVSSLPIFTLRPGWKRVPRCRTRMPPARTSSPPKRFVDRRGYAGTGYGNLEFADLLDLAPAMVPVDVNGYPHFVVFRGARGNRVLLADPAFGNHTMLIDKFAAAWIEYPDVGKVGFVVEPVDGEVTHNQLAPRPQDFVSLR